MYSCVHEKNDIIYVKFNGSLMILDAQLMPELVKANLLTTE